jgi:hypothetical protein
MSFRFPEVYADQSSHLGADLAVTTLPSRTLGEPSVKSGEYPLKITAPR